MPNTFFGVPVHPLLVHVPVVLIPLAALGALAIVLRPSWRDRFGLIVAGVAGVAAFGAFLAASAGESLQASLDERSATVADHIEWGDRSKVVALLFFLAVSALVAHGWWAQHAGRPRSVGAAARRPTHWSDLATRRPPRWLGGALAAATVVTAIAATGTIVYAGHLGAKAAWSERVPTASTSRSGSLGTRRDDD